MAVATTLLKSRRVSQQLLLCRRVKICLGKPPSSIVPVASAGDGPRLPERRTDSRAVAVGIGAIANVGRDDSRRRCAGKDSPSGPTRDPGTGIPLASSTVPDSNTSWARHSSHALCKVGIEVAMENGIANGLVTVARTAVGDFSCENILVQDSGCRDKLNYRRQESAAIGARTGGVRNVPLVQRARPSSSQGLRCNCDARWKDHPDKTPSWLSFPESVSQLRLPYWRARLLSAPDRQWSMTKGRTLQTCTQCKRTLVRLRAGGENLTRAGHKLIANPSRTLYSVCLRTGSSNCGNACMALISS